VKMALHEIGWLLIKKKKQGKKRRGEFCVLHRRAQNLYQIVTPVLHSYPSSGLGAVGQFRTRVPRHNISPPLTPKSRRKNKPIIT